jgi:hypothetical protein
MAKKNETSGINLLKKTLCDLKNDFAANENRIFEVERRLTNLYDKKLQSKVSGNCCLLSSNQK